MTEQDGAPEPAEEPIAPLTPAPQGALVTHVVGIGSSAGGLEALQALVRSLPLGRPFAYVVAQHLAPQHKSLMAELLARETDLRVVPAADGDLLEPGTIYVTPPSFDVSVQGARVRIGPPAAGHGPKPSVDGLFRSLARAWGDRAVGVVLSGTGSDGAHGLREIKAVEGLTIAQTLATAKYDSMPRAALALGAADLELDPEQIGSTLARLADVEDGVVAAPVPQPPSLLRQVLTEVRAVTSLDFSEYKESTLLRQMARRMAVLQLSDPVDYVSYLRANPGESRILVKNLLVTVTSFLRDPEVWEALRTALAQRLGDRPADQPIRAWVAGCATGEEVYTLAMIISEVLGRPRDLSSRLKIFGTDLDEESLDYARRASYPLTALESVPEDLRQAYFSTEHGTAEVLSSVKDCTVFARHNVGTDPPFLRMDVVSCRNTLIYFTPRLQETVLQTLHYALSPGGVLVLGASEGPGRLSSWFSALAGKQRLYLPLRRPPSTSPTPSWPTPARSRVASTLAADRQLDDRTVLRDTVLRAVAPPSVVVNEGSHLVEVVGDVSRFCRLPDGQLVSQLSALLREPLVPEARTLLAQVRAHGRSASSAPLDMGDDRPPVRLSVRAIPSSLGSFTLVSFEEVPTPEGEEGPAKPEPGRPAAPGEVQRLGRELAATQETLQATIEELETSNEELQAMNEELMASSEELQASNEELETTNEELQATNEELGTLNEELQARTGELALANTDLQNILESLSNGMVLVDRDLRVTRFSPLAVRVFALIDEDIGRPLTSVPLTVAIPALPERLAEVLSTGRRHVLETSGERGDHLVQLAPYRGEGGAIIGVVITVTDVTETALLRRRMADTADDLRLVTDALDEVVWRRDVTTGRLVDVSSAVEDLIGITVDEALGHPDGWDGCIHRDDLIRHGSPRRERRPRRMRYRVRRGEGWRWVEDVVRGTLARPGQPAYVIGTVRDQDAVAAAEQRATNAEGVVQALLGAQTVGSLLVGTDLSILRAGPALQSLVGHAEADLQGRPALSLIHPDDAPEVRDLLSTTVGLQPMADDGGPGTLEVRIVDRDGRVHWAHMEARSVDHHEGPTQAVLLVQDLTETRERDHALGRQARFDATTGLVNRPEFRRRLDEALADDRSDLVVVTWIDLDGFKEVNDQFGHGVGDGVLREIAERLRTAARRDDVVGRLGGDEFGVLLRVSDPIASVEPVIERILAAIRQPITHGQAHTYLTGSAGISVASHDVADSDQLLRQADIAMYAAKSAGGDRLQYYQNAMNDLAERRVALRQDLAAAIRDRRFVLHYQPILDVASGAVWGVESLLRWLQDSRLADAEEFVDFAEQTGQLRALGRLSMELLQQDLGRPGPLGAGDLRVAVNMALTQLEDRAFVDQLNAWPIPGSLNRLLVDITETVLADPGSPAWATLEQLRRLGAVPGLDDMGTGYFSVEALRRLNPGYVKLDGVLIERGAAGDELSRSFIRAVVATGAALGVDVVAEGVQAQEHLDLITDAGVRFAQGRLLAAPMPLADLSAWLHGRAHARP